MSSQPEAVKFPLPPSPVPLTRLLSLRMAAPLSDIEFREGHVLLSMRELPVTWEAP